MVSRPSLGYHKPPTPFFTPQLRWQLNNVRVRRGPISIRVFVLGGQSYRQGRSSAQTPNERVISGVNIIVLTICALKQLAASCPCTRAIDRSSRAGYRSILVLKPSRNIVQEAALSLIHLLASFIRLWPSCYFDLAEGFLSENRAIPSACKLTTIACSRWNLVSK